MRAGNLRHRVTIQSPINTRTASGGTTQAWSTVATVWAEVRSESGSELIKSGREVSQARYRIWMRYRDEVTTKHRIVYGVKAMNILSASVNNQRTELEIIAEVVE